MSRLAASHLAANMQPSSHPPPTAEFVEQVEFLGSLARHLVQDEHTAEDLAQEAHLACLERPPSAGVPLRAWFHGILKHLSVDASRGRGLRSYHEGRYSRTTESVSTDTVAERLEVQRILAELVEALEEPYRRAVYLRFYEGLPPREIARREGLPVATVKTHLRRALEKLRTRLDTSHDGHRASWCLALAPLIAHHKSTSAAAGGVTGGALIGGLLVHIKLILVLGASLLTLAWWLVDDDALPMAESVVKPALEAPQEDLAALEPMAPSARHETPTERTAVDADGEAAREVQATTQALTPGWIVRGRVTSRTTGPLAGATVVVGLSAGKTISAETNARGEYAIEYPLPESLSPRSRVRIYAETVFPGHARVRKEGTLLTLTEAQRLGAEKVEEVLDLTLEQRCVLLGTLVHADGSPAPGTSIGCFSQDGQVRRFERTDEAGRVEFRLERPGPYRIEAGAPITGLVEAGPFEAVSGRDSDIGELQLPGPQALRGRVLFRDGSPLTEGSFRILPVQEASGGDPNRTQRSGTPNALGHRGSTDEQGNFEVAGVLSGYYELVFGYPWFGPGTKYGPYHSTEFADVRIDLRRLLVRTIDQDGLAISGAELCLSLEDGGGTIAGTHGPGGRCLFEIELGTRHIVATMDGAAPAIGRVEVTEDVYDYELVLTMDFAPTTGDLFVDVRDSAGQPMLDWSASLLLPGGTQPVFFRLAHDGAGVLRDLPIGNYGLRVVPGRAEGDAYFRQVGEVQVLEDVRALVPFTLEAGGWIDVTLTSTAGLDSQQPEVEVEVELLIIPLGSEQQIAIDYLRATDVKSGGSLLDTVLGVSGKTRLLHVGDYELSLKAEGFKPLKLPVSVHPHTTVKVEAIFERE